jgi:hypothetical protein
MHMQTLILWTEADIDRVLEIVCNQASRHGA